MPKILGSIPHAITQPETREQLGARLEDAPWWVARLRRAGHN